MSSKNQSTKAIVDSMMRPIDQRLAELNNSGADVKAKERREELTRIVSRQKEGGK